MKDKIPLKFYIPNYLELLFDFFDELNIKTNSNYSNESKDKVLNILKTLLNQEIIM